MKSLPRTRYRVRGKPCSFSSQQYGLYKLLPILLFSAVFLFLPQKAFAANSCTWTNGGGDNLWNNASNWSNCGGTTPGSADTAIFDSANSNANVTINATISVAGLTMQNGYSGTISQGTNTITVSTTGWTQSTGTFTGGSGAMTISGPFSLSGGTFTSTSNTLSEYNNWTITGGTFNANSGTILFFYGNGGSSGTLTITPSSETYNNVTFGKSGCNSGTAISIANGTTMTINGTTTIVLSGCGAMSVNGPGNIVAKGNVATSGGGSFGSAIITLAGSGTQTFAGDSSGGLVPGVTINKSGGSVTFSSTITVTANWTVASTNAGTISYGTSTMKFLYANGNTAGTLTITPGTTPYNNVTFGGSGCLNATTTTVASGTMTVAGILTFTQTGCGLNALSGPGVIAAQGNVTITSGSFFGSVPLTFSGTATQTFTSNGFSFSVGTITINKSSGTVTLAGNATFNASGQDLMVSSGTFDMSTFSLTVNDILSVGGILKQGSGALSTGTLFINSNGTVTNTSTGGITIGSGGVTNFGNFNLGSATTCGGTDNIAITSSSSGTAQNWTGTGNYNFYDIQVKDQNENPFKGKVIAWSSTNNGNTNFTVNSGCPPGPVMNLKLDEGTGTTANDASKNGNNGTLNGSTLPAWQSTNQCVIGKCLYFDGSSSYVAVPDVSTNNTLDSGKVSVAAWVRANGAQTANANIIDKGHNSSGDTGWALEYNSSGNNVYFWVGNGTTAVTPTSTTAINDNQWHYVVGVYDGTTAYLYVDGKLQATSALAGTVQPNTTQLDVGRWEVGTSRYFKGYVDEAEVFSYALSSAQVQASYNRNAGTVLGASTNSTLSNGLVGYWKMDEASWNGTSGEVQDSSGNGNNGTSVGSATTTTGKFGNAGSFDGSNDYVNVGNPTSLQITDPLTVSAWIKMNANGSTQEILGRSAAGQQNYDLFIGTSNVVVFAINGINFVSNSTISTGIWYHIVGVYVPSTSVSIYINGKLDKATTTSIPGSIGNSGQSFRIASRNDNLFYFNGTIDEARVYNRALSSSEVTQLYNFAPGPVGYWSFENGSGSTVSDVSGNGNTGTWNGTLGNQWTTGKYGKAGNFNGTDNYVSIPNSTSLRNTRFTLNFWIYANSAANTSNWTYPISSNNSAQTGENYGFAWNNGSGSSLTQSCEVKATNSTYYDAHISTTMQPKTWYFVTCTYDGTNLNAYLNGVLQSSVAAGTPNTGTTLGIGAHGDGTNPFTGKIDQVQIYNYSRTPSQIVQDMNTGHPLGDSPVGSELGWWKFDEGYGTTANNNGSAGSTLNGTLSGTSPTWTNAAKFGRALSFGGAGYVSVADSTAVDPTSDMTLSAWVNLSTNNALHEIAAKDSNTGGLAYRLYTTSTGKLAMDVKSGTTTNTATGATILATGKWYHVVGVYSAGNSVTVYVNGIQDGQTTSSIVSSIGTNSQAFTIGADLSGTSNAAANFMSGSLDEVKLFGGAMTAQDVLNDYNRGSSQVLGSLGNNSGSEIQSQNQAYCVPGDTSTCSAPLAEYNFEEGSGTTPHDDTGNGNDITFSSSSFQWTQGKIGKALSFNGSGFIDSANADNTLNFTGSTVTLSAWIKPSATTNTAFARIVSKDSGSATSYALAYDSTGTKMRMLVQNASSSTVAATGATSITNTKQWYFVEGVYDGSTLYIYVNGVLDGTASQTGNIKSDTNPLCIGGDGSNDDFKGAIDQVRVYNYNRSQAQIAWDYNRGLPVGWWKFDEGSGTTANDMSGNNNVGTINSNGGKAVGNLNTSSTMWGDGASGKFGHSLSFDGSKNYVSIPASNSIDTLGNTFTYSAWIKTSSSSRQTIFGHNNQTSVAQVELGSNCGAYGPTIIINGTNITSVADNIDDGTWHLLTFVKNGTGNGSDQIYIDGIFRSAYSGCIDHGASFTNPATALEIGRRASLSQQFNGLIDDARVYNYPLTQTQINALYNFGQATQFGNP